MTNIIFWDYDGTIANTEIVYKKATEEYLRKQNELLLDIPNEYFFKNISGHRPEEFLPKLIEDGFINSKIEPEALRQYYGVYFNELQKGTVKITEKIDLVIEKLSQKKDLIMCITSSSLKDTFMLKHTNVNNKILNKTFNIEENIYLCGCIKDCKFKPYPDIFLHALADIIKKYNLNINKNTNIIVVEDSTAGCQAGHSFKLEKNNEANITVIGYLGGTLIDNTKELLKNGADIVAKNYEELYTRIDSIFSK